MKSQRKCTRHLVGLTLALAGLLNGLALPAYPQGRPAPSEAILQTQARDKHGLRGGARRVYPDLKADYQFTGALRSSMGTVPELTSLGGNQFVTEPVDGIPRTVLSFSRAGGLALPSAPDVIPRESYSIVMLFRLTDNQGWERILDFHSPTSAAGLYSAYGRLMFFTEAFEGGEGSAEVIASNTYVQVALTRGSDQLLKGYVNGALQFVVEDSFNLAVIDADHPLGFFQDDSGLVDENPAGAIARLRLYDGALSESEVAALDRLPAILTTMPGVLANVSAASYAGAGLAPDSIVAAFGANLAASALAATDLPLPTALAGTTVKVRDSTETERLAPLFYVSSSQVNYLMPAEAAPGPATVTVTNGDGTSSVGAVEITAVAPGLFSSSSNGQGLASALALRVSEDGTQSYEPVVDCASPGECGARPIDLGPETDQVYLVLYGTGIRFSSSLASVGAKLGDEEAPVSYAGPAPGFAGLDQINLLVPRSLVGRGEIEVALTVDGQATNKVKVTVR